MGVGAAKPCAPPTAYAENAFTDRAGVPCRDGDRLRSTLDGVGGGDLGRFAALAKGDVVDANASNPLRLCACDVDAVEGEAS